MAVAEHAPGAGGALLVLCFVKADWRRTAAAVCCGAVDSSQTTAAVQRYLDELAGLPTDCPSEPLVRALLARSVDRLHLLCARLLYKSYPRLARGPVNLDADELLSGVVERLIKAMRQVRPGNVRQFFALANQHIRWELNEVARRLDRQEAAVELRESRLVCVPPPDPSAGDSGADAERGEPSRLAARVLDALDALPEEEREVFNLVRLQGMTHTEAAAVIGCSSKTVQRRLNRGLMVLSEQLRSLAPAAALAASDDDTGPSAEPA